jgi:replicative DNA helicase
MTNQQKWQPIAIEVEQAVLGTIMVSPEALGKVSSVLEAEHFYDPFHAQIYQIVATLAEAGKLVSVLTVPSFLLPEVPGTKVKTKTYMARCAAESVPPDMAVEYAKHLKELARRRRIGEIAVQMAPDEATDASRLAAEAIEALDTVIAADASAALPAASMAQVMIRAVDKIAKAYQSDSRIIGIPTGLRDLDTKLGGLQPETLVVLAGRPGMGKSAFLLTLLRRSAEANYRSLCFSKEMSAEELGERVLSDYIFDLSGAAGISRLPYNYLRNGNFHENMFQHITAMARRAAELPIDVEEQPGLTMAQIATRCRRYKRRHGRLDIVAIDHLDLIKPSGRYMGNKVYELGEITAACKALAKELKCVVVLLSQLSREVEKREDKRPVLADLRSSGSIEQDADVVLFLYRPSYYLANAEPTPGTPEHLDWQNKSAEAHNKLFAIIAKQRMGPTGSVELFCDIGSNAVRDLGLDNHLPGASQ